MNQNNTSDTQKYRKDPFPNIIGLPDKPIYGEAGEIDVSCDSAALRVGSGGFTFNLYDASFDTVTEIQVPEAELDLDLSSRNVARMDDAFYSKGEYPTFEDATKLHKVIDLVVRSSEEQVKVYT